MAGKTKGKKKQVRKQCKRKDLVRRAAPVAVEGKPIAIADGVPVYCAHDAIVKVSTLKPNPSNPNKHPPDQIALLAKIISVQGWRAPITISTRSGYIVRGHCRMLSAKAKGLTEAPVDYQMYDSDEAELADMVADNRLSELAEIDNTVLFPLLHGMDVAKFDLELFGFNTDSLSQIQLLSGALPRGGQAEFASGLNAFESDHMKGKSEADGNWFYFEYYGQDKKFKELQDRLREAGFLDGIHELVPDKMYDLIMGALGK